jgi:hypothetical protein
MGYERVAPAPLGISPIHNGGLRYIGRPYIIDGNWPRHAELNLPFLPDFAKAPIARSLVLGGRFRMGKFFAPHRDAIRERCPAVIPNYKLPHARYVVLAHGNATNAASIFPSLEDMENFFPEIPLQECLFLMTHTCTAQLEFLRKRVAWAERAGWYSMLAATQRAERLVTIPGSLEWWAGFLAPGKVSLLLDQTRPG